MSIWTVLCIILLIAWLGGFTVFHVAGGLIHLLLVFAVISLISTSFWEDEPFDSASRCR